MGLDMYLYRQPAGTPSVAVMNDLPYEQWRAWRDDAQVASWRKVNAIHAWFVDNIQGGVDECRPSPPIDREQLAGLVQRCKRVIGGEPPEKLLPCRSGFFFGSTDYDEYYYDDLRDTVEMLEPLLAERNSDVFVYESSW